MCLPKFSLRERIRERRIYRWLGIASEKTKMGATYKIPWPKLDARLPTKRELEDFKKLGGKK